jgi:predicted ester cyclase
MGLLRGLAARQGHATEATGAAGGGQERGSGLAAPAWTAAARGSRRSHRRRLEDFATGETAVVDELCSPDLVEHQFGLAGVGAEAIQHLKDAIRDVHTAIPDLSFTIEDAVETGDAIWVRVRVQGTATGPFFGPPSGRPVDIAVVDIARIVNGRIVEHWGVPDRFALLAQTGILSRLT